jgi:hypothetical protein
MNMSQTEVQGPAKPRRLTVALERSGDRLGLRCRSREWGGGGFMLLWLIGWTVGCVFLAGWVIRGPQLFNVLFAVPFWASWFFVFFMMLKSFFQREELLLDREGATYVRRVLFPLKVRVVPLGEVRSFDQYTTVTDRESGQCQSGIEIRTLGLPIRMAQGLSGPELDWLQSQLNDHLSALRGARTARETHAQETTAAATCPAVSEAEDVACTVLSVAANPVSPPSDCCWVRFDGFDDFGFAKRGRLGWASVLGLAFINAFWNGIVSVFVLVLCGAMPDGNPPEGAMWWGLLVFLIPFEVIGLLMFLAFLAALLEPVHRTVWHFTRRGIDHRQTWLGVGPHWTWDVESLDRIELRRDAKRGRRGSPCADQSLAAVLRGEGRCYRLSLVDGSNAELCSISGLTEGEARWIGDIVLRERAVWFR